MHFVSLLWPLLTSHSARPLGPASPFQALGETSPGKNDDLPRTIAGSTPLPLGRRSFAVSGPLAPVRSASYPVPVRRLTGSFHASFSACLTTNALRFPSVPCDQVPGGLSPPSHRPCRAHHKQSRRRPYGLRRPSTLRGALDRIRTCDLRLRRPTLYPTELRAQSFGVSRTFAGHHERVKRGRGWGARGAPGRQCRRGRQHRARGISRVLSPPKRGRTISLGPASPPASSDLPGTRTGRATPCPLFGLAPGGACRATSVTGRPVRSYRAVSPLPEPPRGGHRRSALCCAFRRRRKTAPGCYPAPCPVELGLSSGSLMT